MLANGQALCAEGLAAQRAGQLDAALHAFAAACELNPALVDAWNGRAIILAEMGKVEAAAELLRTAASATGDHGSILANRAILLERLGRYAESSEVAEQALTQEDANVAARQTLGLALLRLGRCREAAAQYRRLAVQQPDNYAVFLNLGEAALACDDYAGALTAYLRSLTLNSDSVPARLGQGQALAMLERYDEADACFTAAERIAPAETLECFRRMAQFAGQRIPVGWRPSAREIYLSRRWAQQQICDWTHRADYVRAMGEYADRLQSDESAAYDPSLVFQSAQIPLAKPQRLALVDALARRSAAPAGRTVRLRKTRTPGPLRLGFISAEFHETPVAQLHWRQLALHDRSRFAIHAYSLDERPASAMRRRIVESVDRYCDLSTATADEAAWRIARDGIDILVDLTGHVDGARPEILAMRPAPLRVSLIGGLTPIGKQFVDYKFTDRIATRDPAEFSEALAFLPDAYFIYNDGEQISPAAPARKACGLPEEGLVLCAFNSASKIEPDVFQAWMDLLRELPGSVLWLRDSGKAAAGNLRSEATARGIDGKRLIFAPGMARPDHLARHACADLFLDTWICNAATTAADALWAGLPVLTRAGDTMASRVAASLVAAAGLPELVVDCAADYRALALRLANEPGRLAEMRARLVSARTSGRLFDTQRKVRQLERGFETMWERHMRGLAPASFDIPDAG